MWSAGREGSFFHRNFEFLISFKFKIIKSKVFQIKKINELSFPGVFPISRKTQSIQDFPSFHKLINAWNYFFLNWKNKNPLECVF